MGKIIDLIMTVFICIIFAPLIVIFLLLLLMSNIPKIENTFFFGIFMWIDTLITGAKSPWTLKKRRYLALAGLISYALWAIILITLF